MNSAFRIFNQSSGPGSIDMLIEICSLPLKKLKNNEYLSGFSLELINELYLELVKRKEIEKIETIPEIEKRRIWLKAKQSEEKETEKLKLISRSIYLSEIINADHPGTISK